MIGHPQIRKQERKRFVFIDHNHRNPNLAGFALLLWDSGKGTVRISQGGNDWFVARDSVRFLSDEENAMLAEHWK